MNETKTEENDHLNADKVFSRDPQSYFPTGNGIHTIIVLFIYH